MLYIVYTVLLPIDPFDYIYKKKLSDTKMAAVQNSFEEIQSSVASKLDSRPDKEQVSYIE